MSPTLKEMEAELYPQERWTNEEMSEQINKIHNINCLEFMRKVPDGYFDLVLTDPPYGLGDRLTNGGSKTDGIAMKKLYKGKEWDVLPSNEIFEEIFRISKNQIIWGGNYFDLPPTRGFIVWDKKQTMPNYSHVEYAWTSFDYPAHKYEHGTGFEKQHPTQKPLKLIEFCINYGNSFLKSKTIFDPFMGSGTTAVACESLGLEWCGCELEHDYVEIANKRLSKVQLSLF